MNDLQELIDFTKQLCDRLEKMANEERKFGYEMCAQLDQVSYDMSLNANNLSAIKNYYGV